MDWEQFNEQLGGLLKQASDAIEAFMTRAQELDQLVKPELRGMSGVMVVSGPRLSDDEVKELMDLLPPMLKVQFLESVKRSTLEGITEAIGKAAPFMLIQMALMVSDNKASLQLALAGTPIDESNSVWSDVQHILEKDDFVKTWTCQMNEKVLWEDAPIHGSAPTATASKPKRSKVINDDDVIDLKAALGKSQSVEQFMDEMFGPKDESDEDNSD